MTLPRRRWLWLGAAVVAGVAGWLWFSGLAGLGLAWLDARKAAPEWRDRGVWLPAYHAEIDARPIEGLSDNVSGLTYSPVTGSLFTVINRPPAVAELSVDGQLLRLIPIDGAQDPEGITHVTGTTFVIADEGTQRLNWVEIGAGTTALALAGTPHLTLDFGNFANMGFEGVTWDERTGRLLVAQEMWPIRVLIIEGLAEALSGQGFAVRVQEWAPRAGGGHFAADLSSLSVHDATGNLLLLSHLTSALLEFAPDGSVVSLLPLWAGHAGLAQTVPQAEGLATAPSGEIFLVSEPNLFYRLARETPPVWAKAQP